MAEQLPVWNAPGVEPTVDLKTNGWKAKDKPPADYMNWLFNRAYKCIEELQAGVGSIPDLQQSIEDLEQNFATHSADVVTVAEANKIPRAGADGKLDESWLPSIGDVKNNYTAITNPSLNDDTTKGYGVGSKWINISTDVFFICVDATTGTAKWKEVYAKPYGVIYENGVKFINFIAGYNTGSTNNNITEFATYFYVYAYDSATTSEISYVTDIAVDLTDFTTLNIEWDNVGTAGSATYSAFVVSSSKIAGYNSFDAQILETAPFGKKVSSIDVSALNGKYFIRVHARDATSSAGAAESKIRVYKIWGV